MTDILDEPVKQKKKYTFKTIPVTINCILIFAFTIMYLNRMPGGLFFLVISTSILAAYSIFSFIILRGKNNLNTVFFILSLIWILLITWGAFFNRGYPMNTSGLTVFFVVTIINLIIHLIIYLVRYKK